jgi:hypothetical protein
MGVNVGAESKISSHSEAEVSCKEAIGIIQDWLKGCLLMLFGKRNNNDLP